MEPVAASGALGESAKLGPKSNGRQDLEHPCIRCGSAPGLQLRPTVVFADARLPPL